MPSYRSSSANCCRSVALCRKKFNQTYSSYSHEFPVDSITVSYYDDAEQHQLLLTVYSDGVCILNNAFVSVKYPGGGAAELYQALDGDRGINRSFSI